MLEELIAKYIPSTTTTTKKTPSYSLIKFQGTKHEEKILNVARETKQHLKRNSNLDYQKTLLNRNYEI